MEKEEKNERAIRPAAETEFMLQWGNRKRLRCVSVSTRRTRSENRKSSSVSLERYYTTRGSMVGLDENAETIDQRPKEALHGNVIKAYIDSRVSMANDRQKINIVRNPDVDIISDLPESIIDTILMCLPTRDAARTCILSRKWRYRWGKLPQLILDRALWQQSMRNQQPARVKFAMIVCQILSLHQGPITKFTLSVPELKSCPEMDTLICYVSRNGVEEFTLQILLGERYKLPSPFFMSQQLRHLCLHTCLINLLPSTFRGFSRLITLEFHDVVISAEVLECLISHCPSLEKLVLQIPNTLGYLEINAPKLKLLAVFVFFQSQGRRSSIIELFDRLPALEHLQIDYHFIKYLAASGFPTRLPTTLVHLKVLNVSSICLDEVDLLSCTLCLIRSSPNLQTIEISVRSFAVGNINSVLEYLKMQDYSDVTLNHLLEVKLQSVTGKKSEMELIKLLLAKSPLLKKMMIEPVTKALADKGLKILKELIKFQRASPNVEVIVKD